MTQAAEENQTADKLRRIFLRILDEAPCIPPRITPMCNNLDCDVKSAPSAGGSPETSHPTCQATPAKKVRLSLPHEDEVHPPRRSERSRKNPRDIAVSVKADMTLRDLRVSFIGRLNASPIDQHFALEDGREITVPNETTLRQLNMHNGQVLLVWTDSKPGPEDNLDPINNKFESGGGTTETGFAGTRLLKR